MATVLLIRHGRTAANAAGVLAGWTPGVDLDDVGRAQAQALAARLALVPLAALHVSPLERCQQTAGAIAAVAGPRGTARPPLMSEPRLGECHYGDWTNQELRVLTKDPLWKVVQSHPSAAVFPGPEGESLRSMQVRAVDATREIDAAVEAEHGSAAVWAAVSHGDVIKAILADALGLHLDSFQRIHVSPCSVSIVQYTPTRPFVVRSNDIGGDLSFLVAGKKPRKRRRPAASDAAVGGGA